MTARSFESLASERRLKNRVTDDDLFKQVALVSIVLRMFTYYHHLQLHSPCCVCPPCLFAVAAN
jgi:hypothetical protein